MLCGPNKNRVEHAADRLRMEEAMEKTILKIIDIKSLMLGPSKSKTPWRGTTLKRCEESKMLKSKSSSVNGEPSALSKKENTSVVVAGGVQVTHGERTARRRPQ